MKQKREDWELCLAGFDLNKLVFFDESGVNTFDGKTSRPMSQRQEAGRFSSRRPLRNVDINVGGSPGGSCADDAAGWSCECRDVRRLR